MCLGVIGNGNSAADLINRLRNLGYKNPIVVKYRTPHPAFSYATMGKLSMTAPAGETMYELMLRGLKTSSVNTKYCINAYKHWKKEGGSCKKNY